MGGTFSYWGGPEFNSWPGDGLPWLRFSIILFRHFLGLVIKLATTASFWFSPNLLFSNYQSPLPYHSQSLSRLLDHRIAQPGKVSKFFHSTNKWNCIARINNEQIKFGECLLPSRFRIFLCFLLFPKNLNIKVCKITVSPALCVWVPNLISQMTGNT
jgi:hypothetical protein